MFIFERLIGVASYALVLALICFSLVGKNAKQIKRRLFLYSILLSVGAFYYVPYETADLYRIYEFVEGFERYNFKAFVETHVMNSDLGASGILYWLISQTGIPKLLPSSTAFVCYNCIFYIIGKTAEKNSISGKNVAITLFFYMSIGTYMFVISGIRCMLGISLLAYCFYRENVEKKFNLLHLPLYVVIMFVHPFAAVLLATRFVVAMFDTNTTPIRKLLYTVFLAFGIVFVFRNFESYIDAILEKADSYLTGDAYSYVWEYVIAIATLLIVVTVLLRWKVIQSESHIKLNIWFLYEIVLIVVALAVCYEFTIFHRTTTYIMPIIALPMLMTALQANDDRRERANIRTYRASEIPINLNTCMIAVSALLLLIACSRGSLSSFKFFVA